MLFRSGVGRIASLENFRFDRMDIDTSRKVSGLSDNSVKNYSPAEIMIAV